MRSGSHGDGVDGECMSDRGFRSSFKSNAYTTTTNISSVNDDDMTTTGNDDIARRATHAGHDLDCPSSECGAIQEAGGSPIAPSDPFQGASSLGAPASAVLPGHDSQASCTAKVRCHKLRRSVVTVLQTLRLFPLHQPTRKDKVERTGTKRTPEA